MWTRALSSLRELAHRGSAEIYARPRGMIVLIWVRDWPQFGFFPMECRMLRRAERRGKDW